MSDKLDHIRRRLIEACKRFPVRDMPDNAIIHEPYIPLIPENWNGYLVLAEAQNLSEQNPQCQRYVQQLKTAPKRQVYERLYHYSAVGKPGEIGIKPWDDGCLKLAIKAALGLTPEETGVGNAVLWSLVARSRKSGHTNINPTTDLERKSAALWDKFLEILSPAKILVAGRVAARVIGLTKRRKADIEWVLPSPRLWSPVSGMFSQELLSHYPAVARNAAAMKITSKNALLYSCLASGKSK